MEEDRTYSVDFLFDALHSAMIWLIVMVRLIGVKPLAVGMDSGSSERHRREPKCWLNLEDVVQHAL